jgi:predicted nucleic acid-binding protein
MFTLGPRPAHISLLLDTNVLNDWRFGKPYVVRGIDEYLSIVKAPPALASVTVFEVLHGFQKIFAKMETVYERSQTGMEKIKQLIASCTVLPFDQQSAEIAAYIFPRLSRSERAKHWADVLIASTALAHNRGIITRNKTDFTLIGKHAPPGTVLRLELWGQA